jgi:glyoxylase-like metal-dependent hydrolase (beta-lactamase superfamily II)
MVNERTIEAVSRRRFLGSAAALTAAAWMPGRMGLAQEAALPAVIVQGRAAGAAAKITTQKLRGGVYVLLGSGGNIAVLPGAEGKVLVDSGYATSKPQILEALKGISADPPEQLINTHWHFDHTDGNEWMHAAGVTITAHAKTRTRMSTPQEIAFMQAHFPPSPAGALPTVTFADSKLVKVNGKTLVLKHYDPAHTDTDISVLFADADVLHAGDTWFNGGYPFIDYSTGGNIDGMIRAAKQTLAMGTESTVIIPGHGPVGDKAQLQAYHDMLAAVRDKVGTLKASGKSLEEAVAAKPTAAFDAKWGQGFINGEKFTGLVYQGV